MADLDFFVSFVCLPDLDFAFVGLGLVGLAFFLLNEVKIGWELGVD